MKQIKKCTLEVLDNLYKYEAFREWWDTLPLNKEIEVESEIYKIIKRRFSPSDYWFGILVTIVGWVTLMVFFLVILFGGNINVKLN